MTADAADALAALRALRLRAHLPPPGLVPAGRGGGVGAAGAGRAPRRPTPTGCPPDRRAARRPGAGRGHLRRRHDRPVRLPPAPSSWLDWPPRAAAPRRRPAARRELSVAGRDRAVSRAGRRRACGPWRSPNLTLPLGQGEQRVVAAPAHVLAGVEAGAALAHDDRAGGDGVAVEIFTPRRCALGVAAVAGGAAALGLGHGSLSALR